MSKELLDVTVVYALVGIQDPIPDEESRNKVQMVLLLVLEVLSDTTQYTRFGLSQCSAGSDSGCCFGCFPPFAGLFPGSVGLLGGGVVMKFFVPGGGFSTRS
jgi:hypothetical protein